MEKEMTEFKGEVTRMKGEFNAVLPKGVSTDKFTRILQTAAAKNPSLIKADRKTLFGAAMHAAQDGLLPDGKEAAIVAYKGVATYIPMVGGLIKMIYRCDIVASVTSAIVHANDKFDFFINESGEKLEHSPQIFGKRGEVIGVYAMARLKSGHSVCEVMTREEVEKIKTDATRDNKMSAWKGPHESEMWRKTAIKRLAKRLPIRTTIEEDDTNEHVHIEATEVVD